MLYLSWTDIADPYLGITTGSKRLRLLETEIPTPLTQSQSCDWYAVDISPSGASTRKMSPETPSQANVPVSKASLAAVGCFIHATTLNEIQTSRGKV
ncbi:unnamed protein product [Penicillium camemberti]|uniref:Str. FM013 n=1 Tax=Penicillium camemberti (strain FM 013) TaxID=1429867 RepID=A0A0G4P908_PENC3|nr:unnamed protein product [Penicillium camemberti]